MKNVEDNYKNINPEAIEQSITIQVVSEINERAFKQKNVIFYNIPESTNCSNDKNIVE